MRRVVITGMGLETPLGNDPDAIFDAVIENRSGIVRMEEWTGFPDLEALLAAPVRDFDERTIPRKFRRTMGRVSQLSVSCAMRAVAAAGLSEDVLTSGRTAVVAGSTTGSGGAEEQFWAHVVSRTSARGLKSTLFFQAMSHTVPANVALMLGITGEVMCTNSACASSTQALGVAADRIRAGRADVALAGGADELHVAGGLIFQSLSAVSVGFNDTPDLTPRPFDRRRDGIVVGEGGGIFVLEERERALARGAPILGEVLGFGTTCDARHMSNPEPAGMASAIRLALADAGVDASAVDYVNAHATGTQAGDEAEAEAIARTLGTQVPVSSSKGHLGHLLGGCGIVEAAICLMAMKRGVAPHTRNLEDPDVAPINLLREPEERRLRRVINSSFAFGGINAVVLLGNEADARS